MAGYIPSGLLRQLLDQEYGIKMGKVQRRQSGLANHTWIVSTSVGKLVLRVPRGTAAAPQLRLEAAVTRHLLAKGFPVRSQLQTYDGRDFVAVSGGQYLTVWRWLTGEYLSAVAPVHLVEAGRTLSVLHDTLTDFGNTGQLIHGDFNPGNF